MIDSDQNIDLTNKSYQTDIIIMIQRIVKKYK